MLDALKASSRRFEGVCGFIYLDTLGNPTVGVGHLLASVDAACALPFLRGDGQPATRAEIEAEYHHVLGLQRAMPPHYYSDRTVLRLPDPAIDALLDSDIASKKAQVVASIPGFASCPEPVQMALLDMALNLGVTGLLKYHHLLASLGVGAWDACATECHRIGISEERNMWTAAMFREAMGVRT